MSRSYKRKPWNKDDPMRIWGKKYANRRVRRQAASEALSTHKSALYKRLYEQWDIRDYESRWSRTEALEAKKKWGYDHLTDEEFLYEYWFPYYRRK